MFSSTFATNSWLIFLLAISRNVAIALAIITYHDMIVIIDMVASIGCVDNVIICTDSMPGFGRAFNNNILSPAFFFCGHNYYVFRGAFIQVRIFCRMNFVNSAISHQA
ncbi:MAG: hypothetical protein AAGJ80_20390, partial [Cyanobacteria bacterium J06553_1]